MAITESPRVVGPVPLGLPMPRDHTLLDPATPRVRLRTVTDRFPFPIPNGWFPVARSVDVAPGELLGVNYFERDLVVYRTGAGEARVLDAYCPHLGAHLAVGGSVHGETVACPFHGWRFDGEGACIEIPYATSERIPAKARIRIYPVVERNGLVFAWHHLEESDPFYEVPVVPEFEDPAWLPPRMIEFRISTSCQEMAENNHDAAHFRFVHGDEEVAETEEIIEGTYKRTSSASLVRETFGLGLGIVRSPGFFTFLSTVTPIGRDDVHVRWTFTVHGDHGPDALTEYAEQHPAVMDALTFEGDDLVAMLARAFAEGVSQDIPIWENKVYRPLPVLTKGESGIIAHRRWSEQFYSGDVEL
jgi:nitrite reductase/ring-hydroxylating ferredoxin subunit